MAIDQQKQPVESDEQILVGDELRPKNAFFIAVAETEARNKASGLPDPLLIELLDFDLKGESLSETIIRERGPY